MTDDRISDGVVIDTRKRVTYGAYFETLYLTTRMAAPVIDELISGVDAATYAAHLRRVA